MEELEEMKERLNLMSQQTITSKDISTLFNVGKVVAGRIKRRAIQDYGGLVPLNNRAVKTESVYKMMKIDRRNEMDIITRNLQEWKGQDHASK